MKHTLYTLLCLIMTLGASIVTADTLYLDDGSVLTGLVIQDADKDCVIATAVLGDLVVSKSHILFQDSSTQVDRLETFAITRDASAVISRVSCQVPTLQPDTPSFKRLITGEVQTICDSNGLEIPFTTQLIGNNSLVTINTLDMAPDTRTLIATTLQDGLIHPTPTGHLAFTTRFIPNEEQTIRVVLKYPKAFKLQSISPEPKLQLDGLIVWEQTVKRQQTFSPTITFMP